MNCRLCGSKETVTDLMMLPDHTCAVCALTACGARPHLLCSRGAACSFTRWGPGDRGRKRPNCSSDLTDASELIS